MGNFCQRRGTRKYIYAPNLEDKIENYNKEVALDPTTEMYIVERITEEDLDQVSQRYSVSIELYRPIKKWLVYTSQSRELILEIYAILL